MIRFIAAIDSQRGIADEHGIPWQGLVPSDIAYYRKQVSTGTILMGSGLYKELSKPYADSINYVATRDNQPLREGFEAVTDARVFLASRPKEELVWNLGGALLYESTFDLADELYLTLLEGDFNCTKFFPAYENQFELVSESEPITENGITFRFTIWKRKE